MLVNFCHIKHFNTGEYKTIQKYIANPLYIDLSVSQNLEYEKIHLSKQEGNMEKLNKVQKYV